MTTLTHGTYAGTPLGMLEAVAVDLETTGLDVNSDRVIQIGAVRLRHGRMLSGETFECLVNPGVPIPAESTRIHGLGDDDVVNAESFAAVKPAFESWLQSSVIIGYAIGFDLAILRREHDLAHLDWQPPPSIDVRYLAQVVAPQLPDVSLETIAGWLHVDITDRHTGLGDARAAAEIFLALLPLLEERGIRTRGQAERACRLLSRQVTAETQLGWHTPSAPSGSPSVYARIDSFPYRHRAADVMQTPPVFCEADTPLREALGIMMSRQVSSVFVRPTDPMEETGIITERDILRAVDGDSSLALDRPVGDVASFPLDSIPEDAFVYRAIGRLRRRRIRHLGVRNENAEIVGAISARDLVRLRGDDAVSLGDAIEESQSVTDLQTIWSQLAMVARGLTTEQVDVRDIAAVISREVCALTRRACELAESQMSEQGHGDPPAHYAVLVLGSVGRGESLLAMDQDNAIVYESGSSTQDTGRWFEILGGKIADILNTAGVPYCQGGIMASNPEWCMSVIDWKRHIDTWIARHSPADIMNTDIFFDAVAVHGDRSLADEITDHAFTVGAHSSEFLKLLSMNASDFKVPLGLFNQFRLDDGRLDLKMGGILPIFSGARVQAIRHGIRHRSTRDRLLTFKPLSELPAESIDKLIEAHRILLAAILQQQLEDIENGITLSSRVDPRRLPDLPRERLKRALELVGGVSDLLGVP